MLAAKPEGGFRPSLPKPSPAEEKFGRSLTQPLSIDLDQEPLAKVPQCFEQQMGVPVLFDAEALDSASIDRETTMVMVHLIGVPAESALNLLLDSAGLAWVYEDEVLWITARHVAEAMSTLRVYNVSDLTSPPEQLGGKTGVRQHRHVRCPRTDAPRRLSLSSAGLRRRDLPH